MFFTSKGDNQHSIYILGQCSRFTDSEIVEAYFHLFDSLFFFSSLKDRCTAELVPKTREGLNHFTIKSVSAANGERHSRISIHGLGEESGYTRKDRKAGLRAYLGILLHEMIHVFLYTYSCRIGACNRLLQGMAGLGHSEAWMEIAFAIENSVKVLLGLEVDLLRKWCLVTELSLNGEPVKNVEVKKWGFENVEIAVFVAAYGKDVRREARMGLEFVGWAREWIERLGEVEGERRGG